MNAVKFGEELPEGWVRTNLENICKLVGGGTPSRKIHEYFGGNILWLTPTEIPKNRIIEIADSKEKITEFGLQKSSAKIVPRGTVLLTSRASIGFVAIAGRNVTTNQGFASFICSNVVYNYFLAYWLWANRDVLTKNATGTTFKEISKSSIRQLQIELPPLSEQKRVVVKIESIFAQIDAARERLEMLTSQTKSVSGSLGALRSSVLKAAFEGKLTNKWRIKNNQNFNFIKISLENLTLFSKNGFTGRPNTNDEGTPRLGIESITNSNSIFVNTEKCKFIDILDSKLNNYIAKKGDLFFCRQNGNRHYVGKCAVLKSITKPMIFSDSLIQFRIDADKIMPEYIVHFANSIFGRVQIEKYCSTTAGNYSINGTNLKQIIINFPSLNEQKCIVAKIESIFAEIDAIEQSVKSTLQLLDQLKNSTLKQAFEGKLVPQDPNDEPVEFILKKIKQ